MVQDLQLVVKVNKQLEKLVTYFIMAVFWTYRIKINQLLFKNQSKNIILSSRYSFFMNSVFPLLQLQPSLIEDLMKLYALLLVKDGENILIKKVTVFCEVFVCLVFFLYIYRIF